MEFDGQPSEVIGIDRFAYQFRSLTAVPYLVSVTHQGKGIEDFVFHSPSEGCCLGIPCLTLSGKCLFIP